MKQKARRCRVDGCREMPHLGGFCLAHYEEDLRRGTLRDQARALLFGKADGGGVSDHTLQEDLHELMGRWSFVCSAGISQRSNDLVPLEHAEYAADWCISLAEQIIEAQRAINAGMPVACSYENTKRWVWERLHGIERTPSPVESTTTEP